MKRNYDIEFVHDETKGYHTYALVLSDGSVLAQISTVSDLTPQDAFALLVGR